MQTVAIIQAESSFNPNAKNASSTASGLAQFINGTFKWACISIYGLTHSMEYKNDPHIQIECLTLMLRDKRDSHWDASSHVWKKSLPSIAD